MLLEAASLVVVGTGRMASFFGIAGRQEELQSGYDVGDPSSGCEMQTSDFSFSLGDLPAVESYGLTMPQYDHSRLCCKIRSP